MPRLALAVLTLLAHVSAVACVAPASKNSYDGKSENYACVQADGSVELTLSLAPLPTCTRLSDLPPENAAIIVEAAKNKTVVPPGTFVIDRAGL